MIDQYFTRELVDSAAARIKVACQQLALAQEMPTLLGSPAGSPLTIPVHPLPDHQVFLLVLDCLQPSGQVSNLPLNGQHIPFVRHIDDPMHIERECLVGDVTELVTEAVGVPSGMLRSEGVGASIPAFVLKEADLLGVFQVDVYVEVATAAYLVGECHLV